MFYFEERDFRDPAALKAADRKQMEQELGCMCMAHSQQLAPMSILGQVPSEAKCRDTAADRKQMEQELGCMCLVNS
jgi:hypothetical protein